MPERHSKKLLETRKRNNKMDYSDYFNDILSSAGNESQLNNETLLAIAKEKGLDDDTVLELQSAFALIDSTSVKVEGLNDARHDGITRAEFVEEEIKRLTDTLEPEEQDAVFTAIEKTAEKTIEQLSAE